MPMLAVRPLRPEAVRLEPPLVGVGQQRERQAELLLEAGVAARRRRAETAEQRSRRWPRRSPSRHGARRPDACSPACRPSGRSRGRRASRAGRRGARSRRCRRRARSRERAGQRWQACRGILARILRRRAGRPPGPRRLRRRDQPDRRHLGAPDLAGPADARAARSSRCSRCRTRSSSARPCSACCCWRASTARRCSCTTSTASHPRLRCCSRTRRAPRTRAATSLVFAIIAVLAGLLAGRAFMTGKGYG